MLIEGVKTQQGQADRLIPFQISEDGVVPVRVSSTAKGIETDAITGRIISANPAGLAGTLQSLVNNYLAYIGMSAANVSDEYVLCYMPATANQSVFGTVTILEL